MVGVTFPDAIAGIMEMPSVQVLERLAQPFLTVKHEAIERVHDTQSPNGVLRRYADLVPHGFFENGGAE